MQLRRICIFLAGVSGLAEDSYEIESIPALLERRQRHIDDDSRHGNRTLAKGLHLLTTQQRSRLQTELEQILAPLLQQYAQNSTALASANIASANLLQVASTSTTASPTTTDDLGDIPGLSTTTSGSTVSSESTSAASSTSTSLSSTSSTSQSSSSSSSLSTISTTPSSSTSTSGTTTEFIGDVFTTTDDDLALGASSTNVSSQSSTNASTSTLSTVTASSSPTTFSSSTPFTTGSTSMTTTDTTNVNNADNLAELLSYPLAGPLMAATSTLSSNPLTYRQIAFASRFVPTPSSILNIAVAPRDTMNFEQLLSMEAQLRTQLTTIREWIFALTGVEMPTVSPNSIFTTQTVPGSSATSEDDLVENLLTTQNALLDVLYNIGAYINQSDSPVAEFDRFSEYVTEVITQITDTWEAIRANLGSTTTTAAPTTTTQASSSRTSLSSSQTSTRVFTTSFLDNTTSADAGDQSTISCLDLTRTWLASALSNLTRVRITVDQDLTQALIKYTDLRATGLTSSLAGQLTEELGNAVQLCTKLSPEAFVIKLGVDDNNELLLHTETSDPEALEDIISVLTFSE